MYLCIISSSALDVSVYRSRLWSVSKTRRSGQYLSSSGPKGSSGSNLMQLAMSDPPPTVTVYDATQLLPVSYDLAHMYRYSCVSTFTPPSFPLTNSLPPSLLPPSLLPPSLPPFLLFCSLNHSLILFSSLPPSLLVSLPPSLVYSLSGAGIAELCSRNASAAAQLERSDLVRAWSAAALVADPRLPVPSDPTSGVPWSQHPFSRQLIHSL